MTVKKFSPDELEETMGPMNSVAKDNAKMWTERKIHSENLNPGQIHRVEVAKKKKAVTSSKKQDRKNSKDIIKYLGGDSI